MKAYRLAPLILVALLGCRGPTPQEAAPVAVEAPAAAMPADAAPPATQPARPATPVGKPTAPVQIELLPHADTVVGVPADLLLSLTPSRTLDRLSVEISGADGITLAPLRVDLGARAVGIPVQQTVQLTRTGARAGSVRVLVETAQGEARRTRVLLLAVNGGEAITPKQAAPVQTTPEGERILSLPVEETH